MSEAFATPHRTGTAAGVPYIAFAPTNPRPSTPLVVSYHLMDPPRSERAMAAALPMAGLDAWRVHLGLPMMGERAPQGGFEEVTRLAMQDGLMLLLAPVVRQAAAELAAAVASLREQLGLAESPLALVGGSAGGAAVLLALAESDLAVAAAVLVNPATRASAIVEAMEETVGPYPWNDERRAVSDSLDFVRRVDEIATRQTPILLIVGLDDDVKGLPAASEELRDALADRYENKDDVALAKIEGLGHALADEPGIDPAPQLPKAAEVDARVTAWLQNYLGGSTAAPA